jgi:hypothetical protein
MSKVMHFELPHLKMISQGGNQNPFIEEEETTQWSKEKVQKDKQRSTKHTHKTKDRVTRTPLKTGGTRKLLNQGFLLAKLKSSLRKFYGRHHDLVDR